MARRFASLVQIVFRTAGRSAFARSAPLYLGIAIVSAIVFAPNAMMASDVTDLAEKSRTFRAVLWLFWLLASTPAARAVLCDPTLLTLRSLPISRAEWYFALGLLLALVELPLLLLFGRGVGLSAGLAVGCAAMSVHALWVTRRKGARALLVYAGIMAAVLVSLPPGVFLLLAIGFLLVALPIGFESAPHHQVEKHRKVVAGPALSALSLAYLVTVWRGHAALLSRALLLVLLGAVITCLAIRNNQIVDASLRSTVSLGVLSVLLLIGLAGVAGPVVRSEREASWLLSVCQRTGLFCALAVVLAVSCYGVLLGILNGVIIGLFFDGQFPFLLRVIGIGAAAGFTVGMIAASGVRFAQRGTDKDVDRLLLVLSIVIPVSGVLVWMFHELSLLFLLLIGFGLLLRSEQTSTPMGRWQRLLRERELGGSP